MYQGIPGRVQGPQVHRLKDEKAFDVTDAEMKAEPKAGDKVTVK